MKYIRIIPRLDIKGPNVVKGIHLEGLRVMGSPEAFARYYSEAGADELIYMDVVASLYGRNSLHRLIERVAQEIFIPMTVGGGLRSIEDIRDVLRAGADKVCLNTAAIKRPELVTEAATRFGSSTIVVAIEVIRQQGGRSLAFVENGREYTGVDAVEWARRVEELGAGELLVTSVDREGTGEGFDIALVKEIAAAVSIPVIAHGGAGSHGHVAEVIRETQIEGVAIASVLHYDTIKRVHFDLEGRSEGNLDFLRSGRGFSKVSPLTIGELKNELTQNGISLRN